MSDDLTSDFNEAHGAQPIDTSISRPAPLKLDYSKYLENIKEFNLEEEQEREFLDVLWSIMRSFAELGFGTDICVKLLESFNEASDNAPGSTD